MNKIIFVFFLSIFIIASVCLASDDPFFWKLKGAKEVYIIGTIHAGVDWRKEMPAYIDTLAQKSKEIVFEADLLAAGERPLEVAQFAFLPGKLNIKTLLKKKAWTILRKELPQTPEALLLKYQPWIIIGQLLEAWIEKFDNRMDLFLLERAKQKKQNVIFLEDWQYQMKLLAQLNQSQMAKALEIMILDKKKTKKEFQQMRDAYLEGKDQVLLKVIKKNASQVENMYPLLFHQRNQNWIKPISKILRRESVLIAVGAGHLLGPKNLIDLLSQKGFHFVRCQKQSCP